MTATAENLSLDYERDKLTEEEMADYLGTTVRALQTKRSRKQIPHGVWNKVNGKTIYSIRRYEQWLESNWVCPPELSLLGVPSASASLGKVPPQSAGAKRSPLRKTRKALQLPPVYVLK